ncbi:uncharacterized protein LOC120216103 [Hibiscus syriacus]|uniref:uncharacterized protein LOC120216103 n=1 Tax=Hibiscus syriacus TaxID=106335 RepID=UPI00192148E7|nr:uncharacterized protein LOC120216103 [Hibiscus syriacus]
MRSMVCSGEREMAMGPQRSKPLHNFVLPCLKWGNRRHLRCMKPDDVSNATDSSAATSVDVDQYQHCRRRVVQRRRSPPSNLESLVVGGMRRRESESSSSPSRKNTDCAREQRLVIPNGEAAAAGIVAVREKIMKDLKTAADEIKGAIFRDEVSDEADDEDDEIEEPKNKQKVKEKEREESPAVEVEPRPWNLRTRRAACKAPVDGEVTNNNYSSPMTNEVFKSPRVRDKGPSLASAPPAADKKRPRPKFSVSLSKEEIEEDFKAIVGHRPPRRPKKRPRNVQKQLDYLFPGLWLTEVTVDSYKVPELAENGKQR